MISETQPIRYMHIRKQVLKVFAAGSVSLEYFPYGGITVAYRKIGLNQYKCAFARCNLKDGDLYNKQEGRNRSLFKLIEDDDVWVLDLDEGANACNEIGKLIYGIKEFRRALRVEIAK